MQWIRFTIETHGICTLAIAIDHVAAVSTAVKHLETTFIALIISEQCRTKRGNIF